MKNFAYSVRTTFDLTIHNIIQLGFGVLLLMALGSASGAEVTIKKIGDRVPLYEYVSAYSLRLAETLPTTDGSVPDLDRFAEGIQYQSAMFAFMFFIDRTRVQSSKSRDDVTYRSLISRTGGLMRKVDWAEFEKYVAIEGFGYAGGFFDGYKQEMIPEDLRKFKESLAEPLNEQESKSRDKRDGNAPTLPSPALETSPPKN